MEIFYFLGAYACVFFDCLRILISNVICEHKLQKQITNINFLCHIISRQKDRRHADQKLFITINGKSVFSTSYEINQKSIYKQEHTSFDNGYKSTYELKKKKKKNRKTIEKLNRFN